MTKETIIAIIALILIGIVAGSAGTIWYYKPKIAQCVAEQIKVDTFAQCLEDKTMGVEPYDELYFINVVDCVELLTN